MATRIVIGLVLLSIASTVHAEVLVYAGSLQRLATGDDPAAQKRKAFVVVDQFQKKIVIVSYGRDPLGKHHDFPVVEAVDYLAFPRGDGQLEDGFATTTAQNTFESPTGGGYSAIFIHGTRVPLVVSISGDVKNVQARAKVLTGLHAGAATTILGAFYGQDSLTVKFDQKRTIEENGAGSTVDAAIAHVVGFLESKGYVTG